MEFELETPITPKQLRRAIAIYRQSYLPPRLNGYGEMPKKVLINALFAYERSVIRDRAVPYLAVMQRTKIVTNVQQLVREHFAHVNRYIRRELIKVIWGGDLRNPIVALDDYGPRNTMHLLATYYATLHRPLTATFEGVLASQQEIDNGYSIAESWLNEHFEDCAKNESTYAWVLAEFLGSYVQALESVHLNSEDKALKNYAAERGLALNTLRKHLEQRYQVGSWEGLNYACRSLCYTVGFGYYRN